MITNQPRVSVLLPVYNAASYLDETLESIAVQSMDCFEVVAVDDGSTDGSPEILKAWANCNKFNPIIVRFNLENF